MRIGRAPKIFRLIPHLIPHMALGVLLITLLLWPPASTIAQEPQAEKVVFSDDFESGDTWDWWTNGKNGNKSIITANVHSGKQALLGRASANPGQPEVGLAFIKNFHFTEQESALDFWFYAGGTAKYKAVVVEAFSKEHSGFLWGPVPMEQVPMGKWTHVSILFSEISRQLKGDEIYRFVIKPTIVPDSGDAEFIIDDVKVVNGVKKPLHVEWVEPGDLAIDVSTRPVLQVFVNKPLDASTVNSTTVCVQDSTGRDVPALLYYSLGQQAVLISPHHELAPRSKYTVVVKGGPEGIIDENATRLPADYTW
ncbi:MAG: Ig-like domain-containing protein, partial [Bacillota bacterium]